MTVAYREEPCRSALNRVVRDVDVLQAAARRAAVDVNFSIPTLDRLEPPPDPEQLTLGTSGA